MSKSAEIRQSIASKPHGAVFSSADFLSVGSRATVDQTLARLVKDRKIVRLARGLYAASGRSIPIESIATAVAEKTGHRTAATLLGGQLVVPTSGQSRALRIGGETLQLRRMCQRKCELATTPKGRVLLELWTRGAGNLTTQEIQRAIGQWKVNDIDDFANLIPAWLFQAIRRVMAPRKSLAIGLSGAYDWSNSNIKDDALISAVLQTHKFEDVARLCFYYGIPRVKRVFKRHTFEAATSASVTRMLNNISKGLRVTQDHINA